MRTCPNCGERLDPMRGANLDDLLTLLELVRDALERGYPDLAAMVLHVLLEHRGQLGLRARNYTTLLREQLTDRLPEKLAQRWASFRGAHRDPPTGEQS